MRRLLTTLLFILFLSLAFSASAAQWTDALGRIVEVSDTPQRIVSLVPSVTEILFALNLGNRVEGVTRFCTCPPEALAKPKVGGYADPNLEAVVARKPDLVFVSADSAGPSLLARFESLGIPAYVVYPRSLKDTVETIRAVAQVTGVPESGERQARQLLGTIREVEAATAGLQRPKVLLCVMIHPLTVAGPKTLANDLIHVAGGKNVVPEGVARYPTWGPEAVLAADPDILVVSPHPGESDPAGFFERWPELRAVRTNRVVTIESDWIHRPGPRLTLGLAALAQVFHGKVISAGKVPCSR
jgi:iron complex transport system substrate-binding protein